MGIKAKYRNYLFDPYYWKKGLQHPELAWRNLLAIIKHPLLYVRVCRQVEGLIEHSFGALLYETVLRAKSSSPNVVEVGAFKGLSTIYLSLAASKVGKKVNSFELFFGLPVSDPTLDPSFHVGQFASEIEEFETNVKAFGCRDVVNLVIGDARQTLLPSLQGNGFSVAFLDVDVYEVTRELLFQLWSVARGNEVIIVHDVYSPGVRRAVDEFHALTGNVVKETKFEEGLHAKLNLPPLLF